MKIEKDIISILAQCQVEGNTLRITQQLDRKTYAQLNKVLTALGGKWKAAKKVHEFAEDVEALLEEVITTGEYSCIKKDFQFFPTPPALAAEVVAMAGIRPGEQCLEPSEKNRKILQEKGLRIVAEDFMSFEPQKEYDVIVMNPPFSKGQDVAHITKAIGIAKRCVIAISSASVLFRTDSRTQAFRELVAQYGGSIEELPAESFKESGTMVNTALIKVFKQ